MNTSYSNIGRHNKMARKRTSINIYTDQTEALQPEANEKYEGNISQLIRKILDEYLQKQNLSA